MDQNIAIAAQSFTLCDWCTDNAPDDPNDFEHWTCTYVNDDASGTMADLSGNYDVKATWNLGYYGSEIAFDADEICCPTERTVAITFDYTTHNEPASYSSIHVIVDGAAHYSPPLDSRETTSGSWSYTFTLPVGTHTLGWYVAAVPNDVGLPRISGTVTVH